MNRKTFWLLSATLAIVVFWLVYTPVDKPDRRQNLPDFRVEFRPTKNLYLFDYAGILSHYREGSQQFLDRMAKRFGIEALIVSVPDLGHMDSIDTLADDLLNGWQIGRAHQGRGLLLLLSQQEKEVRLEVSYELEDVFTDAFTGYIADQQLKPYFLRNDLGTGLIAVMEKIEERAQVKNQDQFDPRQIALLDEQLLGGGAGARRSLDQYRHNSEDAPTAVRPRESTGAATPQQAWQILLKKWSGRGAHIEKDVYTEMTRMAMGDPDKPDARTQASVKDWLNMDFEVLQDGAHAVIWFGNREGWKYAPFLFCRTEDGWKFDIVYQRRLVVMVESPHWKVMQGDYPYVDLLAGAKQSTNKDIPISSEDIYDCNSDALFAQRIASFENQNRRNPKDFETLMQLARLNVITGRRPNHVMPLLEEAKHLAPASAEPYRYSAIYHVNVFLQYRSALEETSELLQRSHNDLFAFNMLGFLHYRLGDYKKSLESLEQAIEIEPDNVYALALMARDYTLLWKDANKLNPRKKNYRQSAIRMLQSAENVTTKNVPRVNRLRSWMKAWRVI